jgi:hypothetical protein
MLEETAPACVNERAPQEHPAPTPAELTVEWNKFRSPVMPVRPKFDLASAQLALTARLAARNAALEAFSKSVDICTNAEAVSLAATKAAEAFDGLADEISGHYAAQIAAGEPPTLTPALRAKSAAQHEAVTHRDAVRAAELRIQRETAAAKFALDAAENLAVAAAMAVIQCQGEAIAERCAELRREFVETRNALMNIGATRLGNHGIQCSALWLNEVRDPVPEAQVDPGGVRHWNMKARHLVGRA